MINWILEALELGLSTYFSETVKYNLCPSTDMCPAIPFEFLAS